MTDARLAIPEAGRSRPSGGGRVVPSGARGPGGLSLHCWWVAGSVVVCGL